MVCLTKGQLSTGAQCQLDRFSRQYFQLERAIDFPDETCLRSEAFQEALVDSLFNSTAGYSPPPRYELRILKLLIEKIEQSIQDWDEEVCNSLVVPPPEARVLNAHLIFV